MTQWDIAGDGGNAFSFDRIGDYVQGQVLGLEEMQQTDMTTGEPAFWQSGQPKMMYRVTLATALRDPADPADDGKRSIYLRGSRKPESKSSLAATIGAVQAATGAGALATGGTLTLQYIGDGQQTQRGFNPPKQYAASYLPPSVDLTAPVPMAQPPATAAGGNGSQIAPMTNPGAYAPPQVFPNVGQAPAPPPVPQPIQVPSGLGTMPGGAPMPPPAAPYAPPQAAIPAPPAPTPAPAPAAPQNIVSQEALAALSALGITPEQLAAAAAQSQPV